VFGAGDPLENVGSVHLWMGGHVPMCSLFLPVHDGLPVLAFAVCDHLLVAPLNNPGGDRQVIEKVSLRLVRHLLVEPYDDPAT
jgi:hypothetical protein